MWDYIIQLQCHIIVKVYLTVNLSTCGLTIWITSLAFSYGKNVVSTSSPWYRWYKGLTNLNPWGDDCQIQIPLIYLIRYVFVYYIDEELSFLDQCSLYYLLVSDCITKSEYVCWCEMYFLSEIRFGNIYCNTNTPCYTYQVDIG